MKAIPSLPRVGAIASVALYYALDEVAMPWHRLLRFLALALASMLTEDARLHQGIDTAAHGKWSRRARPFPRP